MKLAALSQRFYTLVSPDIPNEWDVEEVMEPFIEESDEVCEAILDHIPVIWPVSHSLCYDFLRQAPEALKHLSPAQLPRWAGVILDIYENDGLRAAQRFMQDVVQNHIARLKGNGGLALCSVEKGFFLIFGELQEMTYRLPRQGRPIPTPPPSMSRRNSTSFRIMPKTFSSTNLSSPTSGAI